jgi:hypothetical protein
MKIIGIDPDCVKSGLAVYEDGKLTGLLNFTLAEYIEMLPLLAQEEAVIAIEDANLIGGMYRHNPRDSRALAAKKAQHVGAIKRQCSVMIELAEAYDVKVKAYKPRQGNWAGVTKTVNNKQGVALLKKHTGWSGRSNNETRSAAFFGWIHLNKGI